MCICSCPADSSIGDLVTHWVTHSDTFWKTQQQRLVTFETFDQSDEETWPDQIKNNDKDKDEHKDKDEDNDKDKYI